MRKKSQVNTGNPIEKVYHGVQAATSYKEIAESVKEDLPTIKNHEKWVTNTVARLRKEGILPPSARSQWRSTIEKLRSNA